MSGIEILPALVYGGLTAAESAAATAGVAGALGTAGTVAGLGAGAGALAGAGASAGSGAGLTAADIAMAQAMDYGGTAVAQGVGEGLAYGAGDTVTGGLTNSLLGDLGGGNLGAANMLSDPSSVLASDATGNAFASQWDMYKNTLSKGLNALNKVGGAINKLPAPVQGLLMSTLIPPKQQTPPPASMPQRQATQAPPMQMAYQSAPAQTPAFAGAGGASGVGNGMGGGYGGSARVQQGLLGQGVTPEELEMLRRLRMQRRM